MAKEAYEKSTLKTGKYTIEFGVGGTVVYAVDDQGEKSWIATVADPDTATQVVEGLVLVEQKRFYHPDATPVFTTKVEGGEEIATAKQNPSPPFLKLGAEKS